MDKKAETDSFGRGLGGCVVHRQEHLDTGTFLRFCKKASVNCFKI